MNIFLILGMFVIIDVHSTVEGVRNRKAKSKPAKESSSYASSKAVTNLSGYQGLAPHDPYHITDRASINITVDAGCCDCGKKKNDLPYPFTPYGPIGGSTPTGPTETDMVGFAQQYGTTGGRGGEVVQINTLDDFIQNVGDSNPRVLMINTDIKAPKLTKVQMGSSKSIIGSNGNIKLDNIYLRATPTTGNIIFQGLIFAHSPDNKDNDDIQLYLNHGKGYWIDHCSFIGHEWSPNDGSDDKLLYIGEDATGATISNCHFGNHRYGLIFGHPMDGGNVPADDDSSVTIFNNRFENIYDRAPGLFRFGHYHVYNNYINNYGLGFTVATRGSVISEYNYFGNSGKRNSMLDDKGSGEFIDTGSMPAIPNQISPKPRWSPSYSYNLGPTPKAGNIDASTKYVIRGTARSTFSPLHPLVPPPIQTMSAPNYPALP